MMASEKINFYGNAALIAAEVALISFFGYAVEHYFPDEIARYISLEVFYCLPILQTAHLAAIHAARRSDTQVTTIVGVAVALVWSATEVAILWPAFPLQVFALNTFTRSVVFTVIGRVVVKLWREREYARKDMLTGLANRMELLERLEAEQGHSARNGIPYSLLFIDIDHFKALNDIHGHRVGDEALKLLAEILRDCSRKMDVSARLGGDEFLLLLSETDDQSCDIVIKRIEAATKQAFEDRFWPISVSIGRVTATGNEEKPDWLLHIADESMYEAKRLKQQPNNDVTYE